MMHAKRPPNTQAPKVNGTQDDNTRTLHDGMHVLTMFAWDPPSPDQTEHTKLPRWHTRTMRCAHEVQCSLKNHPHQISVEPVHAMPRACIIVLLGLLHADVVQNLVFSLTRTLHHPTETTRGTTIRHYQQDVCACMEHYWMKMMIYSNTQRYTHVHAHR